MGMMSFFDWEGRMRVDGRGVVVVIIIESVREKKKKKKNATRLEREERRERRERNKLTLSKLINKTQSATFLPTPKNLTNSSLAFPVSHPLSSLNHSSGSACSWTSIAAVR